MSSIGVDIRPPVVLRLYANAFGVLWCAAVIYGLARAWPKFGDSLFAIVMLPLGASFCWRIGAARVTSHGNWLLVLNIYRTRHLNAREITQVRTGSSPMQPFGRTVYVVTDSDAISLDACTIWGFRKRSERNKRALEAWLRPQQAAEAGSSSGLADDTVDA